MSETENKVVLVQCSNCRGIKSRDLYFEKNVREQWYKTCNNCRYKHKCNVCDFKTNKKRLLSKHVCNAATVSNDELRIALSSALHALTLKE